MWIECQSCKGDGSYGHGCACAPCSQCFGSGQTLVIDSVRVLCAMAEPPARMPSIRLPRPVMISEVMDDFDPTAVFPEDRKDRIAA